MTTDAATFDRPGGRRGTPGWRIDLHPTVVRIAGSVGARLAVGALAVLVAFHFSLLTLVRDLGLDTPLAYLGLVPFISIGIALALPRATSGPGIHDRQLDHIVGLPIAAAAVVLIKVLPHRLSTVYWDDRLDLLTLPLFVFAVSVLLFGVRTTWRYRLPIAFLFMAWPLPYALAIEHAIDLSTSTTINALAWVMHYIPVAAQVPGNDPALFQIAHGVKGVGSFQVEIASACAGVNSMVGFVLVGTAFLAIVGRRLRGGGGANAAVAAHGALGRKLVWLAVGLTLVWALNIARLVLVLWTGKAFGETVALDGLHPFIGIVIFAAAIVVLIMAMPWLGLQAFPGNVRAPRPGVSRRERVTEAMGRPIAATGAWRLAAAAVLAASIVVGVADSGFSHFQLTASDFGTPKLLGFDAANPRVAGYVGAYSNNYDWVKRYFGSDATWHRYSYSGAATPAAYTSGATGAIVADVVDSSKISPFNAYGIEACYAFHGYSYSQQKSLNLGSGVVGYSLAYRGQDGVTWSVLYWIWAVDDAKGNKRYERVVLLKPSDVQATSDADPNANPLKGVDYNTAGNAAVTTSATEQQQLGSFAQTVIAHQPAAAHRVNSA